MPFYFEKFISTAWERWKVARMYPWQVAVHSNGRNVHSNVYLKQQNNVNFILMWRAIITN